MGGMSQYLFKLEADLDLAEAECKRLTDDRNLWKDKSEALERERDALQIVLKFYEVDNKSTHAILAKAAEALDEAIYLLDPDEEDITKETGIYRIVTTRALIGDLKSLSDDPK